MASLGIRVNERAKVLEINYDRNLSRVQAKFALSLVLGHRVRVWDFRF